MCGIAGFISTRTSREIRETTVDRMCRAMIHRGPDDHGCKTIGEATLGHRRLAVIDPARGQQPMATADGRFHIVFNGAIYNFRELRAELTGSGFSFHTDGDTEVLLVAYARWGAQCVARLRGMFAFAIWDTQEATLFLARDPFGIKPLYYRHDGDRLIFASELAALRDAAIFPLEIDPASVSTYLGWLAVPAPRTIYRGVHCLQGGESRLFLPRRSELRALLSTKTATAPATACRSQADFNTELRARLEDTVRAHVVADVPVGAFLSGGLDSAVVVALMARASPSRLKTFSVGFVGPDEDETDLATATARHVGTEHYSRILTGADVAADLPGIFAAMDQPTGDGINTFYASQAARDGGVVAALSGLGADELFGGYPSFGDVPRIARWLPFWRQAPESARRPLLQKLRTRSTRTRKLAEILEHARSLHEICALQRRVFTSAHANELLSADAREIAGPPAIFHPQLQALQQTIGEAGIFETISAWETKTYMADVLLRDSDVMSMRHSLELRVPFVDRPLVEWLAQQPAHFRNDRVHPKSALGAAVADLLPPEILSRKKRGFSLPFRHWMAAELRPFLEATFSESSIDRSGLFSHPAVRALWDRYRQGDDSRQWSRVWSLAVLIEFVNRQPAAVGATPDRVAVNVAANPPGNSVAPTPAAASAREGPGIAGGSRTLLLAPELFAAEGGIARMLRLYLKALCDLAAPPASVQFISLNDRVVDSEDLRRSSNTRLTEWRVCNRQKSLFVRAALAMSRRSDRVVCGHVAQLPVALLAKIINPRLRYYLVAHGIEVWRPFNLGERLALRRAERIFCVSDFTRGEFLRFSGLPPERAVVLPNALDPAFAGGMAAADETRPPSILTVTRLANVHRYKGVEHLIEAMVAIREQHPTAVLRIIGRGDDVDRLQRLRDKLQLQSAVQFLGYVDDARVSAEMQRCTVFALPSSHEGFGLVFVEAMAHGRPCVGARAGGVPEIITPETGHLVEVGNIRALATSCVDALRHPWNEAAILKRADDFSYARFTRRLAELLND